MQSINTKPNSLQFIKIGDSEENEEFVNNNLSGFTKALSNDLENCIVESKSYTLESLPYEMIHLVCNFLLSNDILSNFCICKQWFQALQRYHTFFFRACKNVIGLFNTILSERCTDVRVLNLSNLKLAENRTAYPAVHELFCKALISQKSLSYLRIANLKCVLDSSKTNRPELTVFLPATIKTVILDLIHLPLIQIKDTVENQKYLEDISLSIFWSKGVDHQFLLSLADNRNFCKNVTELKLDYSFHGDIGDITKCFPNLKSISLVGLKKLTLMELQNILNHSTKLESIDLSECGINEDFIELLAQKKSLTSIHISNSKFEDGEQTNVWQDLFKNSTQLTTLSVVDCGLQDLEIISIKNNLKNLTNLNISWNVNITDVALENLLGELPKLKHFTFISGAKVEIPKLLWVEEGAKTTPLLPELETININLKSLKDEALIEVFNNAPNLIELSLSNSVCLTAQVFSKASFKKLKILNLIGCIGMDDKAVETVLPTCKSTIRSLLTLRTNITTESLQKWRKHCYCLVQLGSSKKKVK
ncbi:hypothetical protein ABK040_015580 [Willaertia magna]